MSQSAFSCACRTIEVAIATIPRLVVDVLHIDCEVTHGAAEAYGTVHLSIASPVSEFGQPLFLALLTPVVLYNVSFVICR